MNGSEANQLPLNSVMVPEFDEQSLLENHLTQIITDLQSIKDEYRWEALIVNDGSLDRTTAIADTFDSHYENVFLLQPYTKRFRNHDAYRPELPR